MQARLGMGWALFGCVAHRLGTWNTKGLIIIMVHCQELKKIPQPQVSWLATEQLPISPSVPILGASTMQRTSQDSPSITVSPPVEGAIIADVDSVKSPVLSAAPSVASNMDVKSAPLISVLVPVKPPALRVDSSCVLHPFYVHKLDSGPVRLMTIANAFNYRVAVLRDGVRSATVQITFIFIGQTRLVFGNCVCTCVTKHSNAFRTF